MLLYKRKDNIILLFENLGTTFLVIWTAQKHFELLYVRWAIASTRTVKMTCFCMKTVRREGYGLFSVGRGEEKSDFLSGYKKILSQIEERKWHSLGYYLKNSAFLYVLMKFSRRRILIIQLFIKSNRVRHSSRTLL